MDKRYMIKFSFGFFLLILLMIFGGLYVKENIYSINFDDYEAISREEIEVVSITSSEVDESFRSLKQTDITEVYKLIKKLKTKKTRETEETVDFLNITFTNKTGYSRLAYTFYSNGLVKIQKNNLAFSSVVYFKVKDDSIIDEINAILLRNT